jgi:Icc-related predicted phosphoesterase
LVVISDFNGSYGSTTYDEDVQRAIALLPAWQPDIVISGGDMVAGQSKTLARERIEAMWAGFDTYIAEPLRQANLPFGFTVGNHDASRAVGVKGLIYQQERDLAAAYWNDPAHDPRLTFVDRAKFPFYYSFQHKDVFYLVWDASSGLKMPAEEVAWVEQSLSSDLAQSAKLRIVIGHLPLYAVAVERDRIGEVLGGAEELHALLERYSVHTYVSGHHHAYYPGHLGQLQFLHAGAIGSGPRQLLTSSLSPRKTVTVVDINLASADTIYTTYDMKDMQVVEFAELPRAIASHNGFVMRRDLAWTNLSPDEQAACIQRLSEARCQTPL